MKYRIDLTGALVAACLPALLFAAVQLEPAYRLNQLALGIADGPAPLRADLARIAIGELASTYADEAQRARREPRAGADGRRWAGAVQQLADDYRALADSITFTTPVNIDTGPDGSLYFYIDGRLVVAGSPRMNEQAQYERRVVGAFCALNSCAGLVQAPPADVPVADTPPAHATRWLFSDVAGPVCSSGDGLEFQFRTLENMDRKRIACQQLVSELNLLAAAIAQRLATGTRVDWNSMAISGPPGGSSHTVRLNPEGDTLQLDLPVLSRQDHAFRKVLPWLAAKTRGERFTLVILDAGRLLSDPAHPLE